MTEVYWNLHKGGYSVRERGRVIAHVDHIVLRDARFVVQRGGYERTVRERVKRVHAMVRGEVVAADEPRHGSVGVTYNPYRADHFQVRESGERIDAAGLVWFGVKDGKPVVLASHSGMGVVS
jgi:hypothetical protein